MMRIQFKLQKGVKSLDYFTSNQWIFSNNNLRELFKRLCEHDRVVRNALREVTCA